MNFDFFRKQRSSGEEKEKPIEAALATLLARMGLLSDQISALRSQLGGAIPGESVAAALGYRGDNENKLYRSLMGGETPLSNRPAAIPLPSSLCQQVHFSLDQYRFWVKAMKERPKFLRKQWEFFYIAQALHERDFLKPGMRGLAFGVGREPLPSLFASFGCEIVATDQNLDAAIRSGWVRSDEHSVDLSKLNERNICTDALFSALVTFREVDMNDIPTALDGTFDFCWSSCSLEHLGSLRNGIKFVSESMRTLRPGGIAVHTTEFNLSSNEDTVESADISLYRRRDIDELVDELRVSGHSVEPIDWTLGEGLAETVIDLPPFGRGEPHLRLKIGGFDCTSIGLIIRKNAAAQ